MKSTHRDLSNETNPSSVAPFVQEIFAIQDGSSAQKWPKTTTTFIGIKKSFFLKNPSWKYFLMVGSNTVLLDTIQNH